MAENDTQSRKWLLTINNPSAHGLNHAAIREILKKFKSLITGVCATKKGRVLDAPYTYLHLPSEPDTIFCNQE